MRGSGSSRRRWRRQPLTGVTRGLILEGVVAFRKLWLVLFFVAIGAEAVFAGGGESRTDPAQAEPADATQIDRYLTERESLVSRYIVGAGIEDPATVEAMLAVPRHEFVPPDRVRDAYVDRAMPIGSGQTISQPYIVAFMTEALQLEAGDRVLEIGTGSGYQAAILAEIVDQVYSIEIIESLAASATARLDRLGYHNVTVVHGDGYYGLPDVAPFDAVIVTAAAGHIPTPLVEQLKPGGRMIIPVGPVYSVQVLILLTKTAAGEVTTEQMLPVRFVPMTGRVQE